MKTAREPEELQDVRAPVVLALGFFDGVHRGHQAVLHTALEQARARNGDAWALTFEPHPARVVRPADAPFLLTPLPEKKNRIAAAGMDGCIVMPFTPTLAEMEPEAFFERLCRAIPALAGMAVGARASFGRGGRGDARLLEKLGAEAGLDIHVVRQIRVHGIPVSSTRIRAAVATGHMENAAQWLGWPFSRSGIVEQGRGVGRKLGFPTLNIRVTEEALMPPAGIYAARVRMAPDRVWNAAAYRGPRPTFETDGAPVLEAHLLDFDGDLYGAAVEVEFLRRIRSDRRFDSTEELRAQMTRDIEDCRAALQDPPPGD